MTVGSTTLSFGFGRRMGPAGRANGPWGQLYEVKQHEQPPTPVFVVEASLA